MISIEMPAFEQGLTGASRKDVMSSYGELHEVDMGKSLTVALFQSLSLHLH